MASGLTRIVQSDYAAGIQPDVARHLISTRGAYDIINGLLDDDGSVYRRGGAQYQTTAGFGTDGLRWGWSGVVAAGNRTLVASPDNFAAINSSGDGFIDLGGDGMDQPYSAAVVEGLLFIGGPSDGHSYIYGGSRKAAAYTTGTITVANGSKTVTGAGGTAWLASVDEGMLLQIGNERVYVVADVGDDDTITLRDAYEGGGGGGQAYSLRPLYEITDADPYQPSPYFATAGNRLLRVDPATNHVHFAGLDVSAGRSIPHSWGADDFHAFANGVEVLGLAAIGEVAVVPTTEGAFTIQGLSYELVDELGNPQQRVDHVASEVLWENAGMTAFRTALVMPCQDAIYLFSPSGQVDQLSISIESLYRSYIDRGFHLGVAEVYNNHLFLPILNGSYSAVDLLVCRLDRPGTVRGQTAFPWVRLGGSGAAVAAVFIHRRASGSPELYAAQSDDASRLLKLNSYFNPTAATKNDPDGSTHEFWLVTRDYLTGPLNLNRVRKVRMHYDLIDADADDPTIRLDYSVPGVPVGAPLWGTVNWGAFNWTAGNEANFTYVVGDAPETAAREPYVWPLNRRVRQIRLRLRSSGPSAKLVLRHLEIYVAPSQQIRR